MRINDRARTDRGVSLDVDVRDQTDAASDRDMRPHDTERTDLGIVGDHRSRVDGGERMYLCHAAVSR